MAKTDEQKKSTKPESPGAELTATLQQQIAQQDTHINELKATVDELTNKWKRALADYQNLQKRTQEQKQDFVQFAIKNFLEKLLGVVDDLEKAQAHIKDEGLGLALKKLETMLKQEGLERIDTKDKDYDIETMEAISLVEGEKDNKVVNELRRGYRMHGSVLRPAQVTVSKKK